MLELSYSRLTNFVWFMLIREKSDADVAKLKARIWRPPVTGQEIDARSPWSAENERKAFAALKAQLGK